MSDSTPTNATEAGYPEDDEGRPKSISDSIVADYVEAIQQEFEGPPYASGMASGPESAEPSTVADHAEARYDPDQSSAKSRSSEAPEEPRTVAAEVAARYQPGTVIDLDTHDELSVANVRSRGDTSVAVEAARLYTPPETAASDAPYGRAGMAPVPPEAKRLKSQLQEATGYERIRLLVTLARTDPSEVTPYLEELLDAVDEQHPRRSKAIIEALEQMVDERPDVLSNVRNQVQQLADSMAILQEELTSLLEGIPEHRQPRGAVGWGAPENEQVRDILSWNRDIDEGESEPEDTASGRITEDSPDEADSTDSDEEEDDSES